MSFYLAVDAGGTKTEYLLADDIHELARVRTGSIKRMRVDAATATRNLEAGLRELSSRTGISMQSIQSTCIGAAGSSVALVADWLRSAFHAHVSGLLALVGDVDIALDAAFHGEPGIVVIAGTGSNVAGRARDGIITTVGGWGPALADQASGHRVGLQGLRALFLALDQQLPTLLSGAILDRWQLADTPKLVEVANRLPPPDFSELAPVIVTCAEQGDPVALAVLQQEAAEMAHLIQIMIARLTREENPQHHLPEIAFAGSMLEHVPLLRKALVAALHVKQPRLQIRDAVVDPLLGALWQARSKFGR